MQRRDVLVGGAPWLSISIQPTEDEIVYLAIDVPFPLDAKVSGAPAICDTCAFDQAGCEPLPPGSTPITGSFYTWLQFYANVGAERHGDLNTRSLSFSR